MTWRTWLAPALGLATAVTAAAWHAPTALAQKPGAPATPTEEAAPRPQRPSSPGSPARQAPPGHRKMQITLQAPAVAALGKPLPLEVTLANPDSTPQVIEDPAQSLDIEFHFIDQKTREDLSFTPGRVTATIIGTVDEYALELPNPKPVTIAPKATLPFKADANMRLFLRPGDYEAFVTLQGNESNRVPVQVRYTRESVTVLFATAHDPQMGYGRREWAMDRLARLFPAFKLNLPLPSAAADARAQSEAGNQAVYMRFAEWWRDQLATADLDQRLEEAR